MTDTATTDLTTTVDTYLDMWNETDPARRARHIERAWTGEGHYVDPLQEAQGPTALGDMVAGVHAQFPGHRFRRVSGIDTHHGLLRFAWELVGPDDAVVVAGIDVGVVSPDGRLQRIAGFFGDLPEQGDDRPD